MGSPLDRSFNPSQNPYTDPSMTESETDKTFSQRTLQQSAQKQLHSNDAAIMQREREINDIAKGIIELADIFKDLSTMVIDQGTMLDRIDYNVERMAVDVKEADKELTVVSTLESCAPRRTLTIPVVGHRISKKDHEAEDPSPVTIARYRHVHPPPRKAKALSCDPTPSSAGCSRSAFQSTKHFDTGSSPHFVHGASFGK